MVYYYYFGTGQVPTQPKTASEVKCSQVALITTKYHPEYAGEGIEYSWG